MKKSLTRRRGERREEFKKEIFLDLFIFLLPEKNYSVII
uniref:Uncharacterized protein n=1 Tax=uncultured bacterium contig00064 TaxID=1181547 RepID=A0A806KPL8_9BACT|nr:hypothetical protein [uncultured bacterium contig00064]